MGFTLLALKCWGEFLSKGLVYAWPMQFLASEAKNGIF